MAQLGDIKAAIQDQMKREQFFDPLGNDVTQMALNMFVEHGLKSIQRMLVVRDAEMTTTLTIGPSNYPYPIANIQPPYRFTVDLWHLGMATPLFRYRTIREFHQDFPPSMPVGTSRVTRGYAVYDGNIHLGPAPVQDWTYFMDYVAWLPTLYDDAQSNWYTNNANDVVMFYGCRQAAAWLMEDQLYAFYDNLAQKSLDEVRKTIRNEEVAEGQLQGRLFGAYPSGGSFVSVGLRRRDVYP